MYSGMRFVLEMMAVSPAGLLDVFAALSQDVICRNDFTTRESP